MVFTSDLTQKVIAMPKPLEQELLTYQAHKSELLAKARGKFVLIKDDQIIGTFDTRVEAIRQGGKQFGLEPFFTKKILELDLPLNFTSRLINA